MDLLDTGHQAPTLFIPYVTFDPPYLTRLLLWLSSK